MQDRFKFRAVNMETKEIIYVDNYYWFEENGITEIDNNGTASGHIGEYWINQCTGLKDNNGKLIYEGDVVQIFHVSGTMQGRLFTDVVEWNEQRCRFDTENYGVFDDDDVYEVIGNIYENPELLED